MSKGKKVTAKAVKKVEENKEEKKMKNNQIEKIERAAKAPIIPEDLIEDEEMERIERENEEIFKKIRVELPADVNFAKIQAIMAERPDKWGIRIERTGNDKCRAINEDTGEVVFEGDTKATLLILDGTVELLELREEMDDKMLEKEWDIEDLQFEVIDLFCSNSKYRVNRTCEGFEIIERKTGKIILEGEIYDVYKFIKTIRD